MGQFELNDGLARYCRRPGQPALNKEGHNGTKEFRRRNIEIKAALYTELSKPCALLGKEHLSRFEAGIDALVSAFEHGERWAAKFIVERLWGRIPYALDVTLERPDLQALNHEQLLDRLDTMRKAMRGEPIELEPPERPLFEPEPPEHDESDEPDESDTVN